MSSTQVMAIMPALGLALLGAEGWLITRRRRRFGNPPVKGTYAWTCVFLLILLVGCVVCLANLYTGGVLAMAAFALVTTVTGFVALQREEVSAWVARQAEKPLLADEDRPQTKHLSIAARRTVARFLRDAALLLIAAGLINMALEMPWNPGFAQLEPKGALLEFIMVLSITCALYFLNQRRGWLPGLGGLVFAGIGISQYYMIQFKGTAIMPSDLMALGTAAAVAGSYDYSLSGMCVGAVTTWVVALGLLSLLGPLPQPQDGVHSPLARRIGADKARGVGIVSNLLMCAIFSLAFWFTCGGFGTSYYWTYGIGIDFFNTLDTYKEEGILPGFIAASQDMPIKAPADYDADEAAHIEADLAACYIPNTEAAAQFAQEKPTVIAIMNETFADLSIYDCLTDAGYNGPQFYNSLLHDDTLAQGVLYTSVEGGGTCNTEFEFLTGNAISFIGASKYPYTLYDLSNSASLAAQFKDLGYATTAMHPNLATNWERDQVYRKFGFDQFLSIDDFEGAPVFHNGVTDGATYDRILDLLKADDGPQFIFDVTMQNHSAYDVHNIPADQLTDYHPAGLDDDTTDQLNEYLSCIEASDHDLERFIGQLKELDRPVVLVFFGDHQPSVSKVMNNTLYTDEDELAHTLRIYQTTYFVWANYDVDGNAQDGEKIDTSAGYLGALSMSLAGVPLTEYQKAQIGASYTMPAMNLLGYADADWNWYARGTKDSPAWETYDALNRVEYLEFGSKVQ